MFVADFHWRGEHVDLGDDVALVGVGACPHGGCVESAVMGTWRRVFWNINAAKAIEKYTMFNNGDLSC